jgi:hypothetical protein
MAEVALRAKPSTPKMGEMRPVPVVVAAGTEEQCLVDSGRHCELHHPHHSCLVQNQGDDQVPGTRKGVLLFNCQLVTLGKDAQCRLRGDRG